MLRLDEILGAVFVCSTLVLFSPAQTVPVVLIDAFSPVSIPTREVRTRSTPAIVKHRELLASRSSRMSPLLFMQPAPASTKSTATRRSISSRPSSTKTKKKKKEGERSTSDLAAFSTSSITRADSSSSFSTFFEDAWAATSAGAASGTSSSSSSNTIIPDASSFLEQFLLPVLSTALLITGNTVGASMLVLPELAAGPGMAISSGVLVCAYAMNWLSGLCIAQVAIRQHETSGDDVPSSFKEFAQANLSFGTNKQGDHGGEDDIFSAAAIVSGISIFVNALVLAFDTTKAGQVLESIMNNFLGISAAGAGDATQIMTYAWTALMLGLVSTLSLERLSQFASVMVVGLFVTFAGLLLPGLAQVSDPLAVLTSGPSTTNMMDSGLMESVLHMAPVFVTTLVYQNIVPTVTRILEYDRTKVVSAITLGSILPLFIYEAWCVAVLGGGISTTSSDLFILFSIVTVAGSSMGALMSLSEEFEIILGVPKDKEKDTFSFASVALPSVVGLGVCQLFADDISGALKVAGSYGSPLLYGLIPVAMAYLQQQQQRPVSPPTPSSTTTGVVPGGMAGLGVLGLGAMALIGSELTATASQVIGS